MDEILEVSLSKKSSAVTVLGQVGCLTDAQGECWILTRRFDQTTYDSLPVLSEGRRGLKPPTDTVSPSSRVQNPTRSLSSENVSPNGWNPAYREECIQYLSSRSRIGVGRSWYRYHRTAFLVLEKKMVSAPPAVCDLSQKGGGSRMWIHACKSYLLCTNTGSTVQNGGSNTPTLPENHTLPPSGEFVWWCRLEYSRVHELHGSDDEVVVREDRQLDITSTTWQSYLVSKMSAIHPGCA